MGGDGADFTAHDTQLFLVNVGPLHIRLVLTASSLSACDRMSG